MSIVAALQAECANCTTSLAGRYCHACGQSAHVHKSLLHLGEEVLHGVLHFDAKGLRTLPMLVARPGELTRRYIDGHRTQFVSPLALFLFMVVAMFFVASLTSGGDQTEGKAQAVANVKARLDADIIESQATVAKARVDLAAAQAKGGEIAELQEDLRDAIEMQTALELSRKQVGLDGGKSGTGGFTANTGWKSADDALKHANKNPELTIYKLKGAGAKYSFLLVPITLPFLWLLFWRRRDITMYDHAVFSLYSLSFMALLFSVFFILGRVGLDTLANILLLCMPPIHMYLQLRGTYSLSRMSACWRTGALMLIAGFVFLLYLILILILSVQ
jgi:hypothetical protein